MSEQYGFAGHSDIVLLGDEEATARALSQAVLGLWEVVNNLTRLRPTRRLRHRVTVFWSARTNPDHRVYATVRDLAAELTRLGCDIVTGGGPGLMQAANEGARMAESYAKGTDLPPDESVVAAIDATRDVGGELAGSAATSAIAQAAHATASAWHAGPQWAEDGRALSPLTRITADLAAMNAYTAAAEAFVSVGYRNEDFVDAALGDYRTLVRLNLGRYPEPGGPVDPSPDGPPGPL